MPASVLSVPVQIVGYDSSDGGLFVADDGAVDAVEFAPGDELAYVLGRRHCAGTVHDGGHVACDDGTAPYCDRHRSTWVCAKCTGSCLKDEMDCHDDHAVYLAAFAPDRIKVGVTKEWRLATRLREQGADRGAHLRTVANGRVAREVEADIVEAVGDSVRVPAKRRGLGDAVDDDVWASLLAEFDPLETYALDYGLDLSERPMAETMATGAVRGTKGRLLVLDRGGSTYAVDMRDLVGYEVEPGVDEREMQSSLGAFGD